MEKFDFVRKNILKSLTIFLPFFAIFGGSFIDTDRLQIELGNL